MAKIQYRGHCPHCGRQQAVAMGGMAKHGYDVRHGYFHGTCSGAHRAPMETAAGQIVVAAHVTELLKMAYVAEAEAFTPPGEVNVGTKRSPDWCPWEGLSERQKESVERNWAFEQKMRVRAYRDMAKYIGELAETIKGRELLKVVIGDEAKKLAVGDRFKLGGEVHVVKALKYATARGVGPGINGSYVEHVVYDREGVERQYPKRYCRKVID